MAARLPWCSKIDWFSFRTHRRAGQARSSKPPRQCLQQRWGAGRNKVACVKHISKLKTLCTMQCPIASTQSFEAQHCREHLGLHPCDRRRNLSVLAAEFPGVDFSLVRRDGSAWVDLFRQSELLCELLVLRCRFSTVAGSTPSGTRQSLAPPRRQIEREEDDLWDAHSRETEQELLDRGGKLVEVCARHVQAMRLV